MLPAAPFLPLFLAFSGFGADAPIKREGQSDERQTSKE
jgi:hypothetical protein